MPNARKLILAGRKFQTLRQSHARIQPGDTLILRDWQGTPRRRGSKQRHIAEAVCTGKAEYQFYLAEVGSDPLTQKIGRFGGLPVDNYALHRTLKLWLARDDGFETFAELVQILRKFHGRKDVLLGAIRWKLVREDIRYGR